MVRRVCICVRPSILANILLRIHLFRVLQKNKEEAEKRGFLHTQSVAPHMQGSRLMLPPPVQQLFAPKTAR